MSTPALPTTPINATMQEALLVDGRPRTEVVLIRHGQQHYASLDTAQADFIDPPLSATGRSQAQLLGRRLQAAPVEVIYSSGMRRARETAGLAAGACSPPPPHEIVTALHEADIYRSVPAGTKINEFLSPAQLHDMGREFVRTRSFDAFFTGESSKELRFRASETITSLVDQHRGGRFAVVCHGGLLNALLADVLGMDTDMFFFPAHASVTTAYHGDDRWALGSLNSTSHLGEHLTF